MKYLLILFFSLTLLVKAQDKDTTFAQNFIWNFSVTVVSSYEKYEMEFKKRAINGKAVDLREIQEEDIINLNGKIYVIQKPEPSLPGYVEWLNTWLMKHGDFSEEEKQ